MVVLLDVLLDVALVALLDVLLDVALVALLDELFGVSLVVLVDVVQFSLLGVLLVGSSIDTESRKCSLY